MNFVIKKLKLILCLVLLIVSNGYAQIVKNGVCWATCNVGAPGTFVANPYDGGMFYQFGSNVGWSFADPLTASDGINSWRNLSEIGHDWRPEKDPCPTGWRVPTKEEFESLLLQNNYWGKLEYVNGRFFGNELPVLFFRATGYRQWDTGVRYLLNTRAYYWCSNICNDWTGYVVWVENNHVSSVDCMGAPSFGNPIRCVYNLIATFYANEIHHNYLSDTTFCSKEVNFRAEIDSLISIPESIKWYIDDVEEVSASNQITWSKQFKTGQYIIKMVVNYQNTQKATIVNTLNVKLLWIKIKNVRY